MEPALRARDVFPSEHAREREIARTEHPRVQRDQARARTRTPVGHGSFASAAYAEAARAAGPRSDVSLAAGSCETAARDSCATTTITSRTTGSRARTSARTTSARAMCAARTAGAGRVSAYTGGGVLTSGM